MNTCATCKHWHEQDHDINDALSRLGEPTDGRCGAITEDIQNDLASLDWKESSTCAPDAIWLMTRSDFGCVLWKAKE